MLSGANVLLVTPFDEDGELDERSLESHVDYVLEGGAHGVVGLGTTGEFFTMDAGERARAMTLVARAVRGRVPVTFGIGDSSTRTSVALARHARDVGADCVMLQPPYYFAHSQDAVESHFAAVAAAVDLPLMIYDGAAGLEVRVETMAALRDRFANVRYVKMSIPNPSKVARVCAEAEGVVPLCGDEYMLVLAMRYGAKGSTVGIGNVMPSAIAAFHDAYDAGELEGARKLYADRICPAVAVCATSKAEYIRCFKEVLVELGVIARATTRPPLQALDPVRRDEVMAVMRLTSVL